MASPHAHSAKSSAPLMRVIPEGWFVMGCESGRDDEKPEHPVWVDAFELAAFQTTNADYDRFVEEARHPIAPLREDPNFSNLQQPVVGVSWFDAVAYCEWLTGKFGMHFRLPTEAEWERAARGGAESNLYPWGNCDPEEVSNYADRWKSGPESVGLYSPNPYGIFNLGDNVHEWCSDWYDPAYYSVSPERNPQGPALGVRRASRGGSWRHHIKVTRTAARSSIPPNFKYADYGFRVAADIPAEN